MGHLSRALLELGVDTVYTGHFGFQLELPALNLEASTCLENLASALTALDVTHTMHFEGIPLVGIDIRTSSGSGQGPCWASLPILQDQGPPTTANLPIGTAPLRLWDFGLEVKEQRSPIPSPLRGNGKDKLFAIYPSYHKIIKNLKGSVSFGWPGSHSTINRQMETARRLKSHLVFQDSMEFFTGLRVEGRVRSTDDHHGKTPIEAAKASIFLLKGFKIMLQLGMARIQVVEVDAWKAKLASLWDSFKDLPQAGPGFHNRQQLWIQLLGTLGHVSGHCERQLLDQLKRGQEIEPEDPEPQQDFQPQEPQDLEPQHLDPEPPAPLPQGPAEGQEPVPPNPSGYDHIDENSISSRGKEILALLPMKKCKGKERPYCCFYITPGKLKRSPGFKSMEALAEALAEWEAQGGPDFSHRIKLDWA